MTVSGESIQAAVKSKTAVIGYRNSMKSIKGGEAKTIVIANNIPETMSAEVRHNAKVAEANLEIFDGSSKDLGTACGKPFPVAVMVIKG